MTQRVLVVAAHPDDEVLGAAGAIAWHRRRGEHVSVLILGEGISSRAATREAGLKRFSDGLDNLKREMAQAHRCLGVMQTVHRQFPDNRFDSVDLLELVKAVEQLIQKVKPQVVYTHHGGDLNIDHRLTFEAVLAACRPLPGHSVERLLSFEVLSSTEWAPPQSHRSFQPNVFIDISSYLTRKLAAMACYRSELRRMPHPRSPEAIRAQATLWGAKVGVKAAEAFMLIRERVSVTR